jgi:hypothetical protein
MCHKHYTEEEEMILQKINLSNETVAKILNRTVQSVYNKRYRMGLSDSKTYKKPVPNKRRQDKYVILPKRSIKEDNTKNVQKIVLGNVIIDMVSKTLTVKL